MSIVVVGMGQLGRTFGQGLLVLGKTVVPVRRGETVPGDPELVLITVAEKDLDAVLAALPEGVRDRVALVQNELAPEQWERHAIFQPTVASVFFEKKAGRAARVILQTRIAGPHAELLAAALSAVEIDAGVAPVSSLPRLLLEKNLYILVTNVAAIGTTMTVRQVLAAPHFGAVFDEVLAIERARLGVDASEAPRDVLWAATPMAFDADPEHQAAGRTAKDRLTRTLARADALGLEAKTLRALADAG